MKKLFIIPYRDRVAQKAVFINHMSKVLEGQDYEFIFVHQCDKRPFNRGGMKNIGFLYAKNAYPQQYKDMTFIFHDVDCIPYKKGLFDYETEKGVVKHYYGFNHVLGGMFAIKGGDFERTYGYPNLWGWGFEDNAIKKKWVGIGGTIDRSQFLPIHHKAVIELSHGVQSLMKKRVNPKNVDYLYRDIKLHGFHTLKNVKYTVEDLQSGIKMVNVNSFSCETRPEDFKYHIGTPHHKYVPSKITRMGDLMRVIRR